MLLLVLNCWLSLATINLQWVFSLHHSMFTFPPGWFKVNIFGLIYTLRLFAFNLFVYCVLQQWLDNCFCERSSYSLQLSSLCRLQMSKPNLFFLTRRGSRPSKICSLIWRMGGSFWTCWKVSLAMSWWVFAFMYHKFAVTDKLLKKIIVIIMFNITFVGLSYFL